MTLLENWLRGVKWLIVFAIPVLVVSCVISPIIDALRPWDAAESALQSRHQGEFVLCVGMYSSSSRADSREIEERQRSYILVTKGELVTISEIKTDGEETLNIDASRTEFWVFLGGFAVLLFLTVRFSNPRIASILRMQNKTQHHKSDRAGEAEA